MEQAEVSTVSLTGLSGDGLVLQGDPSGLSRIYYALTDDGCAVYGSDLPSVLALTEGARGVDRAALHEYLRLLDIAPPRTIFDRVRAVEPGGMVRISGWGTQPCSPSAAVNALAPPPDGSNLVEELNRRLADSVGRALHGSTHPAAFLSGGIDSAMICVLAGRIRADMVTLTVGFDDLRCDESAAAGRVAEAIGVRHEVVRFSRGEYVKAFDSLARGSEQPMADPATMATLLAFEHCRERFDVVLDGTGADEAVGAMPPRHVRLAVEYGSRVPAGLRRLLVRAMSRVPALAGYTPILDFEHPAETLMRWQGFTRAEIEELCGEPVALEHTTFYRTFARYPRHAHYERYTALLNAMPCDRLTQAMRLTGPRVRFPFCARDVDGFLRQLPTEWRHLPGQPKRILRELLARYVPRELWDGPKRGFTFPLHDFLAGDRYELVRRHVLEGRWLGRGLLRPEVVRRHAQAYIAGDRRLMFRVWALVVLGGWLDAHEDLIIPPPGA